MKDVVLQADVALHAITTAYEKFPFLSLLSTTIPWLSPVDRMISKTANSYEIGRLNFLLEELSKKVENLESFPASDDFYPTFSTAWASIRRSKSKEKIKYFASILATTWIDQSVPWDEIYQISKLVSGLEDLHVIILREANQIDPQKAFRINQNGDLKLVDLSKNFKEYNSIVLELCISDLISMGLMNDTVSSGGSNFWRSEEPAPSPPAGYSISTTGRWLLQRIEEMATEAEAKL